MNSLLYDIVEWDVHNWSHALSFWEARIPRNLAGMTALEIGARRGGLSVWLAMKGAQVVCSDLTNPASEAGMIHEKYCVVDKITYEGIDAGAIPYENAFDIVAFKSVLGGIGRNGHPELQAQAIEQMHKALKPGGRLLFAENLVASPLHSFLRRHFVKWGGEWRYVRIEEMEAFCKEFSDTAYATCGFLGAFGRTERQRQAFALLDACGLNRLVPETWRYIVCGVATK